MIPVKFIDYQKCHEYARTLGGQYGIPRCDWEDIGSDAFLLAIKRAWRTGECKNIEAAANRLMYTSVLNVINRRNTLANKMIRQADDIDATADTVPAVVTSERRSDDEDWQNPMWLKLFNLERQKLRNERRRSPLADIALKVIRAGLKDSRLWLIKATLKISGSRFHAILGFFRSRFDLCHRALCEARA